MFAGYGGSSWGLKKANIDFECVGISEIDKYAVSCYDLNFPGIINYGDCSKINPDNLPDFDLLTGGFPCQDVSISGKRDLSKGRTNLYKEILRIANHKKPKYMLLENVKGLLSMEVDEVKLVNIIVRDLQKIGYGVCWKVLNSKDYGIPQNRERIWFVCKLGGWDFMEFQFPHPFELKIKLKDILEENVDNKYYLSESQIKKIMESDKGSFKDRILQDKESVSSTLLSRDYKEPKSVEVADYRYDEGLRIREDNLCPSLMKEKDHHSLSNMIYVIHSLYPRTGNPKQGGTGHLTRDDDITYCLDTGNNQAIEEIKVSAKSRMKYNELNDCTDISVCLRGDKGKDILIEKQSLINNTIRRLTPIECFRLMGFLNDEINLDGLSDTQKYRLAGNGWDINLVSLIFKQMFKHL